MKNGVQVRNEEDVVRQVLRSDFVRRHGARRFAVCAWDLRREVAPVFARARLHLCER